MKKERKIINLKALIFSLSIIFIICFTATRYGDANGIKINGESSNVGVYEEKLPWEEKGAKAVEKNAISIFSPSFFFVTPQYKTIPRSGGHILRKFKP